MASDDAANPPVSRAEAAQYGLELRAEVLSTVSGGDSRRRGESDVLRVGWTPEESADTVRGAETVRIDGDLTETVEGQRPSALGAQGVEVRGGLDLRCHGEVHLVAGGMNEERIGAELLLAGMTDSMVAGAGLRTTAPIDLWLAGLIGIEEKLGTAQADGALVDIAGCMYEREFHAGHHAAVTATFCGAVFTTTASGFRPLMKALIGVRNLTPGGGGGGGGGGGSPTGLPPPVGGSAPSAAAASTATATAVGLSRAADLGRVVRSADSVEDVEEASVARRMADIDALVNGAMADVEEVERLHTAEDLEGGLRERSLSAILEELAAMSAEAEGVDAADDADAGRRLEGLLGLESGTMSRGAGQGGVGVEDGHIYNVLEAPVEDGHIYNVLEAPVEDGHIYNVLEAPVEDGHVYTVLEAPVEDGHVYEVLRAPLQGADRPERRWMDYVDSTYDSPGELPHRLDTIHEELRPLDPDVDTRTVVDALHHRVVALQEAMDADEAHVTELTLSRVREYNKAIVLVNQGENPVMALDDARVIEDVEMLLEGRVPAPRDLVPLPVKPRHYDDSAVDGFEDAWQRLLHSREQADKNYQQRLELSGANPDGLHLRAMDHLQKTRVELRNMLEDIVLPYADKLGLSAEDIEGYDKQARGVDTHLELRDTLRRGIQEATEAGDIDGANAMRASFESWEHIAQSEIQEALKYANAFSAWEGSALPSHLDRQKLAEALQALAAEMIPSVTEIDRLSPEQASARADAAHAYGRAGLLVGEGRNPLPYIAEIEQRAITFGGDGGNMRAHETYAQIRESVAALMDNPEMYSGLPRAPGEDLRSQLRLRRDEHFKAGEFASAWELQERLDEMDVIRRITEDPYVMMRSPQSVDPALARQGGQGPVPVKPSHYDDSPVDGFEDAWERLIHSRQRADKNYQQRAEVSGANPGGLHLHAMDHLQKTRVELRNMLEDIVLPYADKLGLPAEDIEGYDKQARGLDTHLDLRDALRRGIQEATVAGDTDGADAMRASLESWERIAQSEIQEALKYANALSAWEGSALPSHLDQQKLVEALQTLAIETMPDFADIQIMPVEEVQARADAVSIYSRARLLAEEGRNPLPYIAEIEQRAITFGGDGGNMRAHETYAQVRESVAALMDNPEMHSGLPRAPGEDLRSWLRLRRDEHFKAGEFASAWEVQEWIDYRRVQPEPLYEQPVASPHRRVRPEPLYEQPVASPYRMVQPEPLYEQPVAGPSRRWSWPLSADLAPPRYHADTPGQALAGVEEGVADWVDEAVAVPVTPRQGGQGPVASELGAPLTEVFDDKVYEEALGAVYGTPDTRLTDGALSTAPRSDHPSRSRFQRFQPDHGRRHPVDISELRDAIRSRSDLGERHKAILGRWGGIDVDDAVVRTGDLDVGHRQIAVEEAAMPGAGRRGTARVALGDDLADADESIYDRRVDDLVGIRTDALYNRLERPAPASPASYDQWEEDVVPPGWDYAEDGRRGQAVPGTDERGPAWTDPQHSVEVEGDDGRYWVLHGSTDADTDPSYSHLQWSDPAGDHEWDEDLVPPGRDHAEDARQGQAVPGTNEKGTAWTDPGRRPLPPTPDGSEYDEYSVPRQGTRRIDHPVMPSDYNRRPAFVNVLGFTASDEIEDGRRIVKCSEDEWTGIQQGLVTVLVVDKDGVDLDPAEYVLKIDPELHGSRRPLETIRNPEPTSRAGQREHRIGAWASDTRGSRHLADRPQDVASLPDDIVDSRSAQVDGYLALSDAWSGGTADGPPGYTTQHLPSVDAYFERFAEQYLGEAADTHRSTVHVLDPVRPAGELASIAVALRHEIALGQDADADAVQQVRAGEEAAAGQVSLDPRDGDRWDATSVSEAPMSAVSSHRTGCGGCSPVHPVRSVEDGGKPWARRWGISSRARWERRRSGGGRWTRSSRTSRWQASVDGGPRKRQARLDRSSARRRTRPASRRARGRSSYPDFAGEGRSWTTRRSRFSNTIGTSTTYRPSRASGSGSPTMIARWTDRAGLWRPHRSPPCTIVTGLAGCHDAREERMTPVPGTSGSGHVVQASCAGTFVDGHLG